MFYFKLYDSNLKIGQKSIEIFKFSLRNRSSTSNIQLIASIKAFRNQKTLL